MRKVKSSGNFKSDVKSQFKSNVKTNNNNVKTQQQRQNQQQQRQNQQQPQNQLTQLNGVRVFFRQGLAENYSDPF
ncbi:hypothetical protein CAter10_2655 [Collimonas arenae]|nr:hypothetical protein CAter10_2655 [Collimonas arenae]